MATLPRHLHGAARWHAARARQIRALKRATRKLRVVLFLVLGLVAATTRGLRGDTYAANWEPSATEPGRNYFGLMPYEAIDTVTGNLDLSFTDVVVSGNGGMGIGVTRTMNYGAANTGDHRMWTFGLTGLPAAMIGLSAPASGTWIVGVEYADGRQVFAAHQTGADVYVLPNLMRLTLSTRQVEFPNGWTAHFETTSGVTEAELNTVTDAYGNTITVNWDARSGNQTTRTRISSAVLSGGSDTSRTIYLDYNSYGDLSQIRSEVSVRQTPS